MQENEVEKAKHGDKLALANIIMENTSALYRIAYGITGNEDDSKEAIGATTLKVYQKINTLKNPDFFKTWITRILINECYNLLKKKKRVIYTEENIDRINWREENINLLEIKEAINSLTKKYKKVVILYYYNDFSVKDISKILNIAEGTVKSRLARARIELKKYIVGEG